MVLSRLIVTSFSGLVELALWLGLAAALIAGALTAGAFGAVVGVFAGLMVEILVFGAILVLHDIRTHVAAIERKLLKD